MRSSLRISLSAFALGALIFTGCETGGSAVAEGRKAARRGDYAAALKHFDDALKADPEDYNALWGKADIYQREGNLLEQQTLLEKLNTEPYKEYAGVIKPALESNYRKQAEAILGGNPVKGEELLRKAIEINKKSEANQTLAELLERRGDEALRKADWKGAAEAFTAAKELRIARKMRSKLEGKLEIASFKVFKAEFEPRFKAAIGEPTDKGIHIVTEQAIYEPKEGMFTVEAIANLGRTEPKTDEEKAQAAKQGLYEVTQALANLSWKMAGKERPEGAMVSYSNEVVEVVAQGLDKEKRDWIYGFRVKLPEDAVVEQVQAIDKGEFKKPEPAPAEGAEGAAAPAEGAEGAAAPAEGAKPDENK